MKAARSIFGVLAVSALAWGCSDSNDSEEQASFGADIASLRAVHLSSDAPAVDVAVDGEVKLESVSYRQASAFLPLNPGTRSISVLVAGSDTSVIDATLDLATNTRYTVLAINDVSNIEPLVISDNNDKPADGFAALRVVHGAQSAPSVDVYVSALDDDLQGLSPLLTDVPFKTVSDELQVPSGNYRVRVTGSGLSDIIYDSGTLELASGTEYIAIASMVNEGLSPIGLTILTDLESTPVAVADDTRARVRVVHASANAPEVDVSVDGTTVLSNVPFGVGSPYLELASNTYNIDVAASAGVASVINADLRFDPRADYTIAAVNTLEEIEALVLQDDNSQPAEGFIRLRLVHAAKSAGAVDVYITAPNADLTAVNPTIEDFAFKAESGYLEVPAGDYQVRIAVANTRTFAIDTGALNLPEGSVRTAFALDPAHGSSEFGVLLLEDLN